jgi:hypothetical protein
MMFASLLLLLLLPLLQFGMPLLPDRESIQRQLSKPPVAVAAVSFCVVLLHLSSCGSRSFVRV